MRLFVSYAHVDVPLVQQIVDILRAGGHEPWFDHRLLPGQDWQVALLKSIIQCDALLYALTPESVASEWCQWEFAQAIQMGKPIVPVLLQKNTKIPKEISRLQYADFSNGANAINAAQLMGGLTQIINHIPPQNAPAAPTHPSGVPAQAVLNVEDILPPPFEWCPVTAGAVTIEYSDKDKKTFDVPAFSIAKYPITNFQYAMFTNAKDGYSDPKWWEYSEVAAIERKDNPLPRETAFAGDNLPRTNVTWYEAVAFCRWLSAKAGLSICLPTEQYWQRAAQGDDGRVYPWGNDFDPSRCNSSVGRSSRGPTSATQYPNGVSPFGVFDLSGNVWEWCLTDTTADSNDISCSSIVRVLRGGSWYNDYVGSLRVAFRGSDNPSLRARFAGFRIARL